MSGGHFSGAEGVLLLIAEQIEDMIADNDKQGGYGYSPDTISEFKHAVYLARSAYAYLNRVDYLVSGDDGEDGFHERLADDMREITRQFDL